MERLIVVTIKRKEVIFILDDYGDVLSVKDLMKILHIGRNTAYMYLQSGEIPNKKVRSKYIIPKAGVASYLRKIAIQSA